MAAILIVEDNESNRDMLSRRLQRKGHQVITAADGRLGYSLACSQRPDLILMDISLPEINGWKVINLLKGEPATRDIPIIVLTAHALIEDRAKAFKVGCAGYHNKPINFDSLCEEIDRLMLEKTA